MLCPYCREPDSRVIDSRLASGGSVIWRRRECDGCARRFTTYERVELALPAVLKTDGQREAFDRKKVLRSFQIACNKRPVAPETLEEHAEALERELSETGEKEVTSLVIGERVMERLKSWRGRVRALGSVYKSFRDIDEFMREMGKLVAPSAQKAESQSSRGRGARQRANKGTDDLFSSGDRFARCGHPTTSDVLARSSWRATEIHPQSSRWSGAANGEKTSAKGSPRRWSGAR